MLGPEDTERPVNPCFSETLRQTMTSAAKPVNVCNPKMGRERIPRHGWLYMDACSHNRAAQVSRGRHLMDSAL